MNRRSLLTGAFSVLLAGQTLRAEEVQLPELTVTQPRIPFKPLPDYGPHVKDRRYLKDFWTTFQNLKIARGFDLSNTEIRREMSTYLDAIGAQFPVTFIGWQQDTDGEDKLIEVTFHRFVENKNPVGCKDLYIDVTIPGLKGKDRNFQHLLNIECRRT